MMNQQIKSQWISALRSGKYTQGRGHLTRIFSDGRKEHCCLGVLCELAVQAGRVTSEHLITSSAVVCYGEEEHSGSLPYEVTYWAGLSNENPRVASGETQDLAYYNDIRKIDFNGIADLIEQSEYI